jgi:hypothetical protein
LPKPALFQNIKEKFSKSLHSLGESIKATAQQASKEITAKGLQTIQDIGTSIGSSLQQSGTEIIQAGVQGVQDKLNATLSDLTSKIPSVGTFQISLTESNLSGKEMNPLSRLDAIAMAQWYELNPIQAFALDTTLVLNGIQGESDNLPELIQQEAESLQSPIETNVFQPIVQSYYDSKKLFRIQLGLSIGFYVTIFLSVIFLYLQIPWNFVFSLSNSAQNLSSVIFGIPFCSFFPCYVGFWIIFGIVDYRQTLSGSKESRLSPMLIYVTAVLFSFGFLVAIYSIFTQLEIPLQSNTAMTLNLVQISQVSTMLNNMAYIFITGYCFILGIGIARCIAGKIYADRRKNEDDQVEIETSAPLEGSVAGSCLFLFTGTFLFLTICWLTTKLISSALTNSFLIYPSTDPIVSLLNLGSYYTVTLAPNGINASYILLFNTTMVNYWDYLADGGMIILVVECGVISLFWAYIRWFVIPPLDLILGIFCLGIYGIGIFLLIYVYSLHQIQSEHKLFMKEQQTNTNAQFEIITITLLCIIIITILMIIFNSIPF